MRTVPWNDGLAAVPPRLTFTTRKDKHMKKQLGFTIVKLLIVVVGVLGFGGWIANIVKLIGSNFDPLTGMVIARAIGVFVAPLGAVLGFL